MCFGKSAAVLVVFLVGTVLAYPFGAPTFACDSMLPNHLGNVPQTGVSPFTIAVSKTMYLPGESVTVTITGSKQFKGFLLQARRNGRHVGSFTTPASTKNLPCHDGNAVTHSARLADSTTALSFQWASPSVYVGEVQFIATVVESFTVIWLMLLGPTLTVISAHSQGGCELPTNQMSLVELSSKSLEVSWKKPAACGADCAIEFTVRAGVGIDTGNKWVSIGFSRDHSMGDDSVVDCIQKGVSRAISVQASYNVASGKNNAVLSNPSEGLTFVSGTFVNGVLQCVFKRAVNTANTKVFDLSSRRYRLLVASGDVHTNQFKLPHSFKTTNRPVMSTEEMDFLSSGSYRTLK